MVKIIEIDGIQFKEYEVNTGKQIAIIRERIATEEEIAQNEYEKARQRFLTDIKKCQEDILLGEATENDLLTLQNEWAALKTTNGWGQYSQ